MTSIENPQPKYVIITNLLFYQWKTIYKKVLKLSWNLLNKISEATRRYVYKKRMLICGYFLFCSYKSLQKTVLGLIYYVQSMYCGANRGSLLFIQFATPTQLFYLFYEKKVTTINWKYNHKVLKWKILVSGLAKWKLWKDADD